MCTVVLPALIYIFEIVKYCIGNKLFFNGKIKGMKPIILSGIIYPLVVVLCNFSSEDVYLISYIAAGISVYFIFSGKWKVKIFRILSILAITACLDELIGIFLFSSSNALILTKFEVIIESLVTIFIFYLFLLLKKKVKLLNYQKNKLPEIKRYIILICLILSLAFAAGGLSYAQKFITDEIMKLVYNAISLFTYGCIIIIVVHMISMKSANEKMGIVIETERDLKQMSENYYLALLRKEEETRKYRHDMNSHILCLKEYARKEKATDTLQYIETLEKRLDNIQKKVYFTGNDILDILLNYYLQSLDNTNISVTGMCKSELKINDVDFCIVISNLLQNSVEEILRLQNTDRYIRISVEQGKSFLRFEIRNSSETVFFKNRELPGTQKEDKKNHGIGLTNVIETIECNQGMFEMEGNGKEVCATVVLPVQTDRSNS